MKEAHGDANGKVCYSGNLMPEEMRALDFRCNRER